MKRFGLKLSLALIAIFTSLASFAQGEVTFTTNAPMKVAEGETFRVEFALNASPDGDSFSAPNFSGFDVIAGPAVSRGSSVQIINGSMTKSINNTYTYVLVAGDEGTFTIGSAKVVVDKKEYSTKPLPIEVVKESESAQTQSQTQSSSSSPEGQIAKDDILLRTVVSRSSLFKGEPLRATVKLYSRVAIAGADDQKMPSFNGFWSQDIRSSESSIQRETYNGKVYETQILSDYLLYPQQSGKLTIEPASMTIIAQVRVPSRTRDPFFGGGFDVVNVRRAVATPTIEIDVKELPAGAPASFSGAVGNFTMESELSPLSVAANSSISYVVRIAGNGNLSLIQSPDIKLPDSFEKYNVKTTESINTTRNGANGYKQFEYPIIPRAEGDYELQPAQFSFFNPKSMQYETLTSQRYNLEVLPDGSSFESAASPLVNRGVSRADVKLLGQDIRFIKIDSPALKREVRPFVLSELYYVILVTIILLFVLIYIMIRRRIKASQNITLTRGKRANKVAIQRFKLANKYLLTQDEKGFYKEVLSAIWGYMSDKFNIPVANLTKENVREELSKRKVSQDLIHKFSDLSTTCDEAQYSPMASAHMNEVYMAVVKLISQIETEIKR